MRRFIQLTVLLTLLMTILAACGDDAASSTTAPSSDPNPAPSSNQVIRIASKNFTEQFIVGEMYALLLEQAGYKVERKIGLGATDVAQAAMEKGEIDIYPEYTGTGLLTVLKLPTQTDPKAVYETVKKGYAEKYQIAWLDPAPMNNTQALAMTKEGAQKFGIITISDMAAKAGELRMIGPPEFQEREDGLPGIQAKYGNFELKEYVPVDPGLKYKGLVEGNADVVVAFGTDGEIANYGLVVLKDDRNMFPPYQIAPLVRQSVLDANPKLAELLNALAPKLDDATMQQLNFEVSGNNRKYEDVAKEFLTTQGLLK
ncbi:glycine betaine ABC transporter substrate-binding protein [Herpetosiphon sp.]|uniref:Substrate-binding region of ABC-type glycine betaine transport system n=1 Tax=Herpetosiphon aurantiacus (strain ATCC 23779 / DSM 785 / 114-95) TaxID=316274 RepID=A9B7M8_HERA2|nr:glycine betaine ABC transporter substrate-binding protein [Herpetosiphon sp.]ABX03001.1 Substrate-binding region of ABC-type glycine betaine transport system [Herpetosiphon aurantiacus DSM 785]